MRTLALAAFLLVGSGCEEAPLPKRPPVFVPDGAVDANILIGPSRDASSGDSGSTDGSTDASLDGSADAGLLVECTLGAKLTIVSTSVDDALDPFVSMQSDTALVAWNERRNGLDDLFMRPVPSSGPLGFETRLTMDSAIESGIAMAKSDLGIVAVYSTRGAAAEDIAALLFDPQSATVVSGPSSLSFDATPDFAPKLMQTSNGFVVTYSRGAPGTATVGRMTMSAGGAAIDPFAETDSSRSITGAFTISENATEARLIYRATSGSLESFRLDSSGGVANPDASATITFLGAILGDKLEATQTGPAPRALLVSATRSSRATAYIAQLNANGGLVGSVREVDTRAISASAIASSAGTIFVAYRTIESGVDTLRLRGFDSAGTLIVDQRLAETSGNGGVALGAYASGELEVIYDDSVAADRELLALRVGCDR